METGWGMPALPSPYALLLPPPQMDLISTIGESAALGAAGVILWGDAGYTTSTVSPTQPSGAESASGRQVGLWATTSRWADLV